MNSALLLAGLLALAPDDVTGGVPPGTPPAPDAATAVTTTVDLFLMPVTVDDEALRPLARAIERRLGQRLGDAGHRTMTSQDVAGLFDLEAARQKAGCDDDSACAAELAGSLGADRIVSANLVRLDERYRLDLTLSDRKAARVLGRGRATGRSADELEAGLDAGIAALFGEALPAASTGPSALAIAGGVGAGVGVVLAAVGGVFGLQALLARNALEASGTRFNDAPGETGVVELAAAHTADEAARQTWNTIGLPFVAVGAGVAVVGGVILALGVGE